MKIAFEKTSSTKSKMIMSLAIIIVLLCFIACDDLCINNVSPEDVKAMIDSGEELILLDVREPAEFCDNDGEIPDGHIAGAINMPYESGVLGENHK